MSIFSSLKSIFWCEQPKKDLEPEDIYPFVNIDYCCGEHLINDIQNLGVVTRRIGNDLRADDVLATRALGIAKGKNFVYLLNIFGLKFLIDPSMLDKYIVESRYSEYLICPNRITNELKSFVSPRDYFLSAIELNSEAARFCDLRVLLEEGFLRDAIRVNNNILEHIDSNLLIRVAVAKLWGDPHVKLHTL